MQYLYGSFIDTSTLSASDKQVKDIWLELFASFAATG